MGIPKLSADSGINQISCLILELTVREVRMVVIVQSYIIPLDATEIAVCEWSQKMFKFGFIFLSQ